VTAPRSSTLREAKKRRRHAASLLRSFPARPPDELERVAAPRLAYQSALFERLHRAGVGGLGADDLVILHPAQHRVAAERVRLELVPVPHHPQEPGQQSCSR
jgi:hypothetical protein